MPAYLVVGATGNQGGATASQLLAKGHDVHAIVRDATSASSQQLTSLGAKVFQGDYSNAQLLAAAISGTVGVFLNPYIDMNDVNAQVAVSRTIVEAAIASGTVRHIVAATAFVTGRYRELVEKDENFPIRWYYDEKAKVEAVVKDSAVRGGYTWTILRPSFLFYNYLPPAHIIHFPELYTRHELAHVYQPGARMPHFDQEDVGKFAVAAFEQPDKFAGESIELGSENLTIDEVAAELSRASGVRVNTRTREAEEAKRTKRTVATQEFHELASWTDISIPEDSLDKYGLKLTTFAEFLEREKDRLKSGFAA